MRISKSLLVAVSAALLLVLASAGIAGAAGADTWRGTLDRHGITGKAALVVPAEGKLTARYTVYDLSKGDVVRARILVGDSCSVADGATLVKELPGFTTTMGGDWRQVWTFGGEGARDLRGAIGDGDSLWFVVRVDDSRACTELLLDE